MNKNLNETLGVSDFLGVDIGEKLGEKAQTYTVGEVASMIGEKTDTVQYWIKEFKGLIPYFKAGNEYKTFTVEGLEVLKRIKRMKRDQGYTIKGIRNTLSGLTESETALEPKVAEMLQDTIQALKDENKALRAEMTQLRSDVVGLVSVISQNQSINLKINQQTQEELRQYIQNQQKSLPETQKKWWKWW